MSFSSSSICNLACSSSGAHNIAQGGWPSELSDRIILIDLPFDEYLDNLVPCSTPYESAKLAVDPNAFSQYNPGKGLEVMVTSKVRIGLENLVSGFDDSKRPTFWDSHNGDYRFPLGPFAVNHATSYPDISVSFPGVTEDKVTVMSSRWEVISMCIEAKDVESKDPFPLHKGGKSNMESIIQIARNARTLMLVHGFLYSFVLGIYGNIVRIARFDRTVCLVSLPFNLRNNLHMLQRFFWHFTHPMVGSPVVGCDPTIRPLTYGENTWLQTHLSRARGQRTAMDVFMTRRVEVYDDTDGTMVPYFVYQLIDVNSRLMSRSTMVWRAIKDTYQTDTCASNSVKTCILKEAWRQLVRRPEADFYRRLESTISDEERWGLPKMLGGGDIGQLELRLWETCSPDAEVLISGRNLRLPAAATAAPLLEPSSTEESQAPTLSSSSPPGATTVSSLETRYPYPFSSPLPWPQHQTATWTLSMPSTFVYRERSHLRLVLDDVGRPLIDFRDTRELVTALRDSIRGHRLAWEKAGILHRDVSLGNILIVDDPSPEGHTGFLHDFDYSSMTETPPGQPQPASGSASGQGVKAELKERTGTRYFMSCEILLDGDSGQVVHQVYHDLESYYWVLLWVALRHTEHNLGENMSERIFDQENLQIAFDKKSRWVLLGGRFNDRLVIKNNVPLTELLLSFKGLVAKMLDADYHESHLTHEVVLRLFDHALSQPGWPDGDHAQCSALSRPRPSENDSAELEEPHKVLGECVFAISKKRRAAIAELDTAPPFSEENTGSEALGCVSVPHDGPPSPKKRASGQGGCQASELDGRIFLSELPLEDYLDNLVPCSSSYESAKLTVGPHAISKYKPSNRSTPATEYTQIVRDSLEALVSDFNDEIRPTFWASLDGDYCFPLSPFAVIHAKSSPDISVSFPGSQQDTTTVRSSIWELISMCIEAKATASEDPFPAVKRGACNSQSLLRLARHARTLMLVHGLLYSFVLGIYGDTVRIARFDRTLCIVSRPFSLREDLHILHRFFWHFTHPIAGSPVVGCDPTIRALTLDEDIWLQRHLSRARVAVERTAMDVFMTRRVEVYDDRDGSMVPYFVYQLVSVNPRLMSRSTMVWRAIKDTYQEDKHAQNTVKTCILKESWRQLVRRPEADFYRRMASTIPDEERWGLPKMVIGGDIGQLELRMWEMCSPHGEDFVDEHHLRLPAAETTVRPSSHSSTEPQAADTTMTPRSPESTSTPPPAESPLLLASQFPYPVSSPLPWPQHQTVTWSIAMASLYAYRDRSHMRFVMEDIGRPLSDFRDTKELVTAMRDAIRGHRLAWEKAGILHRDVSLGNILIVDDPTAARFGGFLHDFDYSSMTEAAPGESAQAESTGSDPRSFDKTELKERTGTRYFMACEILRKRSEGVVHCVYHDLESFYWVLLWIVLRHTRHNLGQKASEDVFEYADLKAAFNKKVLWLRPGGGIWDEDDTFIVHDNAPLTELMSKFKELVCNMCFSRYERNHLTHQAVLDLFDHALAQPGWPANDRVECTLLDARIKQDDAEATDNEPAPQIRRMVISDSALLNNLHKRSGAGAGAGLDVPSTIPEASAEVEAGPSTVRRDGPSNPKKRKSESQAAAMVPPALETLLGTPRLDRATAAGAHNGRKSKRSKRS